jgi:hypothetical protein
MCCETSTGQCCGAGPGIHHGQCRHHECDCNSGGFRRRFITRAERVEWLEDYRKSLEAELEGVKERIAEMSGQDKPGGR